MPSVTVTADELVIRLKSLTSRVEKAVIRAERENIEDAHAALIDASSGPFSQAELTEAGHPYAVRAPQAEYDPAVINVQTGDFVRAWERHAPEVSDAGGDTVITSSVTNDDPVAKYMSGTRLMVPRPIVQAVQKKIQRQRKARVKKAVAEALKTQP